MPFETWSSTFPQHKNTLLFATFFLVSTFFAITNTFAASSWEEWEQGTSSDPGQWDSWENDPSDKDETLLYAAGIGIIQETSDGTSGLPVLQRLSLGDRAQKADRYASLNDQFKQSIDGLIQKYFKHMQNWSSYGTLFTPENTKSAFKRQTGRSPNVRDLSHLHQYFKYHYGIMLIGGLEHRVTQPLSTIIEGQHFQNYHDYLITSVTAVVVDLKSKMVLLSTTALGLTHYKALKRPLRDGNELYQGFAKTYVKASDRALQLLYARMIDYVPDAKLKAERPHWVTAAWIDGKTAPKALAWRKSKDFGNSPCEVRNHCIDGTCKKITEMMKHRMTAVLSEAGHTTLPALDQMRWSKDGRSKVKLSMELDEKNPLFQLGLEKETPLEFSTRNSQYKVIVTLRDVAHIINSTKSKYIVEDKFITSLAYTKYETDRLDCKKVKNRQHVFKKSFGYIYEDIRPKTVSLKGDVERMIYTLSIERSFNPILQHLLQK